MWLDILRIWSRCKTKSYEICGKRCHLLWHSPILGSRGQMWEIGTVEIVEVSVEDILWYLKITLQTMLYTFCRCVELQSHWFSDASNQKINPSALDDLWGWCFLAKVRSKSWKRRMMSFGSSPPMRTKPSFFGRRGPKIRRKSAMDQHIWGCVSLFHFFPFIFSIIFIYNRTST